VGRDRTGVAAPLPALVPFAEPREASNGLGSVSAVRGEIKVGLLVDGGAKSVRGVTATLLTAAVTGCGRLARGEAAGGLLLAVVAVAAGGGALLDDEAADLLAASVVGNEVSAPESPAAEIGSGDFPVLDTG
jgi:hypothetical protein